MYGKALKHHVDTLPDIADQLQSSGGSVSSSQAEQNNRNTISPKTAKTRQQLHNAKSGAMAMSIQLIYTMKNEIWIGMKNRRRSYHYNDCGYHYNG